MKNLSKLLVVFGLVLFVSNSCLAQASTGHSQKKDIAMKKVRVKEIVNSGDFVFEAEHLNGMRYQLKITKDSLAANLPFFLNHLGSMNSGFNEFAIADFSLNKWKDHNGDWEFVIKPQQNTGEIGRVKEIKMRISPLGYASLHIDTRRGRQVSYSGYIKQVGYRIGSEMGS